MPPLLAKTSRATVKKLKPHDDDDGDGDSTPMQVDGVKNSRDREDDWDRDGGRRERNLNRSRSRSRSRSGERERGRDDHKRTGIEGEDGEVVKVSVTVVVETERGIDPLTKIDTIVEVLGIVVRIETESLMGLCYQVYATSGCCQSTLVHVAALAAVVVSLGLV
jgi:hypothetical protein